MSKPPGCGALACNGGMWNFDERRCAGRCYKVSKQGERSAMPECFVAKAAELKDGDRRIVVSGKHEVGVFFKDGEYYAYSNYCVHAGGPACEGILVNKVIDIIRPDRTYEGQKF